MILLSVKESSLLHAVKKCRGQKDPRVPGKHCSWVTQSDLKNVLNKKYIHLLVHSVSGHQGFWDRASGHPMTSMGAAENHGPVVTVDQSSWLTASPGRHSACNKYSLGKGRPRTDYWLAINALGWSRPVTTLLNLCPSHNFFLCLCTRQERFRTWHVPNHSGGVSPHAPSVACTPESLATGTAPFCKTERASKTSLCVPSLQKLHTPPNRRDAISSGSAYCVWLKNKPKTEEDWIDHADTARQKEKEWRTLDLFLSLFFSPLLLTATKQKAGGFKCCIKMSSKASPGTIQLKEKDFQKQTQGFLFVCARPGSS